MRPQISMVIQWLMSKSDPSLNRAELLSGFINWYRGNETIGKNDGYEAEPLPDLRGLDPPGLQMPGPRSSQR